MKIKQQKHATKLNFDSVLVVITFRQKGQVIEIGSSLNSVGATIIGFSSNEDYVVRI